MSTDQVAELLYNTYIESTGRLSYRGSSVLGLKHANDIEAMEASDLAVALHELKIPVTAAIGDSESFDAALSYLRSELQRAVVCPPWSELPKPVQDAWRAVARVKVTL
jgi:signal transduction histidine kinase